MVHLVGFTMEKYCNVKYYRVCHTVWCKLLAKCCYVLQCRFTENVTHLYSVHFDTYLRPKQSRSIAKWRLKFVQSRIGVPFSVKSLLAQEPRSWDEKTVLINYTGEWPYATFCSRNTEIRLTQHDKQNTKIARYVFLLDLMKVNNEVIFSQR